MARKKNAGSGDGFARVPRLQGKDKHFIIIPLFVLNSPEYKKLSSTSKVVMSVMQKYQRTNKFTVIGRQQIAGEMGRDVKTVTRAWKELITGNWLRIEKYHDHQRKETRTWELTWLSYFGKPPADTWRNNNNL